MIDAAIAIAMEKKQKNFLLPVDFIKALNEAATRDDRDASSWLVNRLRPILEKELGRPVASPLADKQEGE